MKNAKQNDNLLEAVLETYICSALDFCELQRIFDKIHFLSVACMELDPEIALRPREIRGMAALLRDLALELDKIPWEKMKS